jgi:hypothetical protein
MVNLRKWSSTASGNATVAGGVSPINFAEGQLPSTVNNSAREMMAQIRSVYTPDEWGWVETSATASVASQTTFKLTGDQTSFWTAGRRWRLKSGSTSRYGAIVSASYTSETTVTVTVDSGSLSASHTLAALSSLTDNHLPATLDYVTSAGLTAALAPYISSNSVSVMVAASLTPYASSNSVSDMITTRLAPYASSNSVSAMIATQIAAGAGGVTYLGVIDTSSGASATLGSLTLTNYKFLRLTFNAVGASSSYQLLIGNSTSDDVAFTPSGTNAADEYTGIMDIDLNNGIGSFVYNAGVGTYGVYAFDSALSTASTVVSVATSAGTLDDGSIRVYGIS